jgi:4'-phosphopantetheinyl transferase
MTGTTVHVWLIPADLPPPALGELEAALDDGERRRAAALRDPGRRTLFVAAHGAARLLLGERLGLPADAVCWRYGPHGKPEPDVPAGPQVSLSHSGDFALLALAARRPVGVDLQRVRPDQDVTRLSARFYPPDEARYVAAAADPAERVGRYTRLWTRKEACVKAAGGRLVPGLRLPVGGPAPVAVRPAEVPPAGYCSGYLVHDVPAPPGYRAAVAAAGTRPYRVELHRWCSPGDRKGSSAAPVTTAE